MKNVLKGIIIGSVSTSLIMSSVGFAENVEVFLNKIIVTVNGVKVDAENVLINGRTYVPLRAISEMLNKDVIWDEKTSTASVNDKDYIAKQTMPGYSRIKPADIGTTLKCEFEAGYDANLNKITDTANITLKEIIRGDKAFDMIIKSNEYNDKPDIGFDYIVAKIEFELLNATEQYSLSNYNFRLISTDGKEYENPIIVNPEPKLDAKLYAGAKHEGYAVFKVALTDSKPLITFGRNYEGKGGIWFKAY